MSKVEQLKELRDEIAGDPKLVAKLKTCKSPGELAEQVALIAKERGYDVAAGDILAVITGKADGTDLTERELAAVSGGGDLPHTLQVTQPGCRSDKEYGPSWCW